ncbi:MAG: DUF3164 family protein [Caulobacteraceae bacterium]
MPDTAIENATLSPVPEPGPAPLPAGVIEVGGKEFMTDAKGRLVPLANVRVTDKLIDGEVRKIIDFAQELSARIARFKRHTLADFAALSALLDQEYGVSVGGEKGNTTFTSFDGCRKVTLQVADNIVFGPELQAAKALVDECLNDWADGANDNLRAIVNQAFNVDQEGLVNRAEMFRLLRLDITDERWGRAMQAIRDSIRVVGAKEYVRFYERPNPRAKWQAVTIDLAAA